MGDDLEIRQRPMTLISAPAEYGKSTLLSDWLATEQLPYDDIRVAGDVLQGLCEVQPRRLVKAPERRSIPQDAVMLVYSKIPLYPEPRQESGTGCIRAG
jgi:hypothetical protein